MTKTVDFYFDFGSPYGYFAAQEIDGLEAETGCTVIWRPYMVGAAFQKTGTAPMREIPLKGEYCLHDWERMSLITGVPYTLPEVFPTAILGPARAFYWLVDQGKTDQAIKLAKATYIAYFAEGRAMWDGEVCADVAEECGIDRTEFLDAIQDKAVKSRLIEEGQKALDRGVFGSPFFICEGEKFWGWDRMNLLREWLKKGKWG